MWVTALVPMCAGPTSHTVLTLAPKAQAPRVYLGYRYRLPGIPKVLGAGRYRGPVGTQGAGTACLEFPRCWVLEGTEAGDPIAPNGPIKIGISGNMGENMELPGLPKQADTHIRCKAVNSKHFSSKANRNTAYGRCSKGAQCWKVQTL